MIKLKDKADLIETLTWLLNHEEDRRPNMTKNTKEEMHRIIDVYFDEIATKKNID